MDRGGGFRHADGAAQKDGLLRLPQCVAIKVVKQQYTDLRGARERRRGNRGRAGRRRLSRFIACGRSGPAGAHENLLALNQIGAVGIDALIELPEQLEVNTAEQLDLGAGIAGLYPV